MRFRNVVKKAQIPFFIKNQLDKDKGISLKYDFYVKVDRRFIKIYILFFFKKKEKNKS
jgi:hypothetical protein